jgi:hypothetical protein
MKIVRTVTLALSWLLSLHLAAWQGSTELAPSKDKSPSTVATKPQQKLATDVNKVQLQSTVRGSQEQPKVLSIVPWQLPLFSRIEGQDPISIAPLQLTPLYRQSFITEQQVYKKLFKSKSNP